MHPSTFRRGFFLFFGKLENKTSNVLLDTLQPTLNYMRLFPHKEENRAHSYIYTCSLFCCVHPDWSAHVDSLGNILINAHVAKGAVLTCKKKT